MSERATRPSADHPTPPQDGDEAMERLMARRVEPTPEVRAAMAELEASRARLAGSLDELTEAAQSALDIPAKIRRNPAKTAALVGGTGFLLAGGPRRVVRFVGKRIRRQLPDKHDGLLPPEIEKVLKDSGVAGDPDVRRALNKDFAEYLRRKGKTAATEPTAARSFWRTFDRVAGPLGTAGARLMIQRLMEAEQDRAMLRSEARARALDRAERKRNA
jgi:hypothetical protein